MTRSQIFIASMSMMLSSACVMAADAIYKVGEINPDATQSHSNRNQLFGGAGGTTVHYGAYFFELNGVGYFVARDGTGYDHDKLWRTDGTPAGTTVVRSLPNHFADTSTTVRAAVKSGNLLYYRVGGISGATTLVRSDGTPAGTYWLASDVLEMANVNGTLYFATGVGKALFKTNGSQGTTVKLRDFTGGSPTSLTNVSGTLFFSADDGTNGRELWKSNGTEASTVMVRDIAQNAGASSNPQRITAAGGKAYFHAYALPGEQLWVSDGTEAGTVLLTDFANSGNPSAYISHLANANGTLYAFVGGGLYANLKIYRSNGTAATTVVADPGPFGLGLPRSDDSVTVVGDTMYFIGGDRAGSSHSYLYKTSGGVATQVSGQYINAQNPVGTGTFASAPILAVGNRVYFSNSPGNTGNGESYEVCAVDHGVAGSERVVADINPLNSGTGPYDFAAYNARLFFTEDNGATGISPYFTDGTTTAMVKDINATTLGSVLDRKNTAVAGGKFFFATADQKLYFSTGTDITLIGKPPAFAFQGPIAGFAAGAVFVGFSAAGTGLHFTDGSTPVLIKAATPSAIGDLHPVGSTLYFTLNAGAPDYDKELWKTDGTMAGTVKIKSFSWQGKIRQMVSSKGITFMAADDGVTGLELWRTDGTEAGTVLVKDIQAGNSLHTSQYGGYTYLFPFSGGVYFMVLGADFTTVSFYKSDGTAPGTVEFLNKDNGLPYGGSMLGVSNDLLYYSNGQINVYNGATRTLVLDKNASGAGFVDVNGSAFFSASADLYKTGVYKSDGSAAGTVLLLADAPSTYSYTSFAGQLYFLFYTANEGKELWRSNGTVAGTFMVQDLLKGFGNGVLDILRPANGALFLNARNTADNPELFATLATSSAGTRPTLTAPLTVYGTVGTPLSVQVQTTGANFSLSSNEYPAFQLFYNVGFLPEMVFNPATGVISGTPLEKGTFRFDIGAQNEAGFRSTLIDFRIGDVKDVLDIDANGVADGPTDGLLALRYLFGLAGDDLTRGAVAADAQRSIPADITQYLVSIRAQHMDVDANGSADALSDGLLIIRYLSGVRGSALIAGAIGSGATRTSAAQIEAYLQSIVPQ